MENIVQIYQAIKVKSIVYETGDSQAKISCDLIFDRKTVSTQLLISHTDLNRLISKMTNTDSEWVSNHMQSMYLEDGSQLIEYNFESQNNETIQNFHFNNAYAQIGA